ncbi:DUF4231 domain-containing protein [Coprobacillus sp. AM26-5AC]|mgnify:CR=1 FL=1|jgi:hypothetical protein|nr:DUF4231 domain-containing protein [Coprobacillus sp. AM26-5AC]
MWPYVIFILILVSIPLIIYLVTKKTYPAIIFLIVIISFIGVYLSMQIVLDLGIDSYKYCLNNDMSIDFKDVLSSTIAALGLFGTLLSFIGTTVFKQSQNNKSQIKSSNNNSIIKDDKELINDSQSQIINLKQQNNVSSTHPNENKKGENKMSIEKYISNRVDDQIKYYDSKSVEYKKKHENISLATIIISALIALVPAFIDILPNFKEVISFISAFLAAVITVLQAIDKLKKYNDLFYQFRITCEKLKQEKELYLHQSGEYKRTDEMTNEQLFVERCESIMATENGTWAQLNEKKQTN